MQTNYQSSRGSGTTRLGFATNRTIAFATSCILILAARAAPCAQPSTTAAQQWEAIQAKLLLNKGLVANQVVSRFESPGDDGPIVGTHTTTIQGWSDSGEPLRVATEKPDKTTANMAELDLSIATRLANHPDELFTRPESAVFLPDELIGELPCSVVQLRTKLINGKSPFLAKVWFEQHSARIIKTEASLPKPPLPGVKEISFTVAYKPDSAGRNLPQWVSILYRISLFFHSGEFVFKQEINDWIATRPANERGQ